MLSVHPGKGSRGRQPRIVTMPKILKQIKLLERNSFPKKFQQFELKNSCFLWKMPKLEVFLNISKFFRKIILKLQLFNFVELLYKSIEFSGERNYLCLNGVEDSFKCCRKSNWHCGKIQDKQQFKYVFHHHRKLRKLRERFCEFLRKIKKY